MMVVVVVVVVAARILSSILSLRFLEMKVVTIPSDFILPEVVYCCPHSFVADDDGGGGSCCCCSLLLFVIGVATTWTKNWSSILSLTFLKIKILRLLSDFTLLEVVDC